MTDPTPDIPLLRKAVEWAEAENAKPLAECRWFQELYRVKGDSIARDCGTAYCIAGYVAEISGCQWHPELFEFLLPEDGEWAPPSGTVGVHSRARRLLGLAHEEAHDLFESGNTIEDVRRIAEQIAARAGERL